MTKFNETIILFFMLLDISCSHDREIIRLLESNNSNNVILGAFKAGETGDEKFVPLLLNNCSDIRGSTNIHFKGFTVYQEKMIALRKIYKKDPPNKITYRPDSAIIKYYLELSKKKYSQMTSIETFA